MESSLEIMNCENEALKIRLKEVQETGFEMHEVRVSVRV